MGRSIICTAPKGLRAQLETMQKYLPEFGIGAPCGFGRAPDRPGRLLSETGQQDRQSD